MAKKANPDVLDAAPDGAIDLSEGSAASLTKQASTAVSVFASLPVWQPHPTLVEIAKLKEEKLKLIGGITEPGGLEVVKKARMEIVRLRTAVDARRKQEGKDARDYVGKVNAAGNLVIEKLEEIEAPLEAAIKAEEQKEIAAALAKAKAIEEEQRQKEEQRLALLKAEEDRKKAEAQALLDKQKAEMDKRREELDKQLADMNRQKDEMKKQQDEIRLENERLQAEARARIDEERRQTEEKARLELHKREEAERMDREEKAEERRKVQAEADRQANEKRIEEAKKAAADQAVKNEQARVAREAEAKRAKEAKDKAAADKKAAQAPDKDKVGVWARDLAALIKSTPVCKDPECIQLTGRVKKDLISLSTVLNAFVEAK